MAHPGHEPSARGVRYWAGRNFTPNLREHVGLIMNINLPLAMTLAALLVACGERSVNSRQLWSKEPA